MKFKKRIVQFITMSLLISLVSCGGKDKSKRHHHEGQMPTEHGQMSVEHQAYDTSFIFRNFLYPKVFILRIQIKNSSY